VADGPVYSSLAVGDYRGGPTGGGVVIDTASVLLDVRYPQINGRVMSVIPDGGGGWYIGGAFTAVGGLARSNIAHIKADRRVDESWDPGADQPVFSLVLSADGTTLYVGGAFTQIGGTARGRLAALQAATGVPLASWNPQADSTVRQLVLSGDGMHLYAGGDFTVLGGLARLHLASLLATDGSVDSGWSAAADGAVFALALAGGRLYAGGAFTHMGSAVRNRIAALAIADGRVDAGWNPDADAAVRSLIVSPDAARLYAGGDFSQIGAAARPHLAAFDLGAINADKALPWNPAPDGPVNALLASGQTLYAGGDFSVIGGQLRRRLAALDVGTDSNNARDWDPGVDAAVNTLALTGTALYAGGDFNQVTDRSTLYLGGDFSYVGPATGGGIGINADPLNPASDQPLFAFPAVSGAVYAVLPDGVGGWYIGGLFSRVGNLSRSNLAHINSDLTVDASWQPIADGAVFALALAGGRVYVGGDFTTIDGQSRRYLAALNSGSGALTAWDPDADAAVRVLALSVDGSTLYTGGDFTSFNGGAIVRRRLAALDTTTLIRASIPTAWDPDADATVRALALSADGSTLYAGGDFTSFNGGAIVRRRLAALDTTTLIRASIPTAWDPDADAAVRALLLSADGSTLYAGGDFTSFNGGAIVRRRLAALDTTTVIKANIPTAWDPGADAAVRALQLSGTTLYAGGDFATVGGILRRRLAALVADSANPGNATVIAWDPVAGGRVRCLAQSVTTLYAGGDFASVGGVIRRHLAALGLNDGRATSWNPDVNNIVRTMQLASRGDTLYIGGDFSLVGALGRNRVAEVGVANALPTAWDPDADDSVHVLLASADGGSLYVGGSFTIIGRQRRSHLAELRRNGTATVWRPEISGSSSGAAGNGVVNVLQLDGDTLYAGGDFDAVGGAKHQGLVALDTSTAAPLSWAPQITGLINDMQLSTDGATLYIGGVFSAVNNDPRRNIAALDTADELATTWNPDADAGVQALQLALDQAAVYLGGKFSMIGGLVRDHLAAVNRADGLPLSSWDHAADKEVLSLSLSPAGRVIYGGGRFGTLDQESRGALAALDALPLERIAPLTTALPPGGEYNKATNQPVVLNCDDGAGSGCATTFYTLDGSTPTTASKVFKGSIELKDDAVLKFFSVDRLGNTESVQSEVYTLDILPPETTASPPSRIFSSQRIRVTLQCSDAKSGCADIFFSRNEKDPESAFTRYTGPIRIGDNTVLRFFSIDVAGNKESVQRENYVSNHSGGGLSPILLLLLGAGLLGRRRTGQ